MNASGDYEFSGLVSGNYFVQVNAANFTGNGALAAYSNASATVDTTPNDYVGDRNYGKSLSGGVVDTNAILIAYDSPRPAGAVTYPGNDTTDTLDVGFVTGPAVGGTSNTAEFYQDGRAVALDGGVTVTDPAAADIDSATVTISSGFLSGDTLNFIGQNGISTGSNAGGVLTLTGAASLTDYQIALRSITYSFSGDPTNAGADTTRTVSWSVTDTGNQTSGTSTSTLDVFALPIVSGGAAGTPTETSTSGAVVADSTLTITDYNGTTIHNASVQITGGDVASDTLTIGGTSSGSINDGASGTITYSFTGSTLTLTGTDTVAEYQAALRLVNFDAVSPNSGTRILTWEVNDQAGGNTNDSAPVTTDVDATFGPQVTGTGNLSGTEGTAVGPEPLADFTDTALTSPTAGDFAATIAWGDGTTSAGTVTDAGGGSFTVTGSAHTYVEEVSYSIEVTVTDTNSNTGSASGTASIADAPLTAGTVTASGGVEGTTATTLSATFTDGNTGAPTSDFSGTINWGDGSSTTNFTSANVTGTDGSFTVDGSHTYAEAGSYSVTVAIDDVGGSTTTDSGTATVADAPLTAGTASVTGGVEGVTAATLTATFTDGNTFAPTSDFSGTINWGDGSSITNFTSANVTGAGGSFTVDGLHTYAVEGLYNVTVAIDDDGGSTTTDTGSTTVAHAPPIVTAGDTATFDGSNSQAILDGALTVSDIDSGGNLTGATVSIGSGFLSGDTLNFVNQNGITGSYDAVHGTLTLTGTSSIGNYQSALDSITYSFSPTHGDPSSNGSDTTRTIDWTVTDGSPSNGTSNTATSTLDIPSLVVTNLNDSGVGSLRQVILDANTIDGGIITFAVSGTIQPDSALPTVTSDGTIDGTSAPGYAAGSPTIAIDGTNAGNGVNGIAIGAGGSGSTVEGLDIVNFNLAGIDIAASVSGVTVEKNIIGADLSGTAAPNGTGIEVDGSGNTIGGATTGDGNVISGNSGNGIDLGGSGANIVEGNFIGTNAAGTLAVGNGSDGILIENGSTDNTIGGAAAADGNVISGNGINGIDIADASSNTVEGNLIGTNAAGTAALGNGNDGILIESGSTDNTIGGATAGDGNVISGNIGNGIEIGASDSNTVEGNFIGTDAAGTAALANGTDGILIDTATNITIGGTSAGDGNIIADNTGAGVSITAGNENAIEGNSISRNAIGIDLGAGANDAQSAPVLTGVVTSGTQVFIDGSLTSTANTTFRIEFFANTGADTNGNYEGTVLLGFENVTTNGSGNANFSATLSANVTLNEFMTATATSAVTSDTSEFSAGLEVLPPVVTVGTPAPAFNGGGSPVTLDSGIAVSDPDSTTLASATVTIATGAQPGDLLSFNNGTNTETFGDSHTIAATYSRAVQGSRISWKHLQ